MGFIFNSDRFSKKKKSVNPFDLPDEFDYDFAESFDLDDYEDYVYEDFEQEDEDDLFFDRGTD